MAIEGKETIIAYGSSCEMECPNCQHKLTVSLTKVEVPAPGPVPTDYLHIARARVLADELGDQGNRLQELYWRGWRDLEYGAANCSGRIKDVFGITAQEMMDLAVHGSTLHHQGLAFKDKLPKTNRRCADGGLDAWCSRSEVRKSVWKVYNTDLTNHMETCEDLRLKLDGQPGFGSKYDSIKGWCKYISRG